ncbi:Putative glycosyltransferase EpsH [Isoptericola dokdonensis DS-3]|uniref:Putative glycosyltransferase EpsH n=1 Tax=Isoptericola dokdonensis DS-3 TaxID=1300344 RepID=A0A168FY64_9MICO|nr:Putative glycosyltransferase EpsH [Isoptericola dokdonensis DS-3]
MTPGPVLSVVVAAFDAEDTLPDQLSALRDQRPDVPWEVLVCDNGSRDATRELVESWRRHLPELRLVDASARRGPAAARNIGVAAARAPWIAFCDADDVVGSGWVDAVLRALADHEFVAGRFDVERLRGSSRFHVTWSPQLDGLTVRPSLPGLVTAGAGNMAMHKAVFTAVGGFDEGARTAEDDDLCLRAQLAGHRLTWVPSMVLHVRRRSGFASVLRQAYAYGQGARRLEHRYAAVSAALVAVPSVLVAVEADAAGSPPVPGGSGAEVSAVPRIERPDRVRRVARRVARVWRPEGLANLTWRVGWVVGHASARVDDVPQVAAPPRRATR